jgi:hypothetical protein
VHPPQTKLQPQRVFDWWAPIWDPGRGESPPFSFTPEFAAWIMERNFDAFDEWRDIARGMGIGRESKDWTFLTRSSSASTACSAHCGPAATGAPSTTRRKGDPPKTVLGRQHQAWKAART